MRYNLTDFHNSDAHLLSTVSVVLYRNKAARCTHPATIVCNSIGGYPVSSSLITGIVYGHLLTTASRTYVKSLA